MNRFSLNDLEEALRNPSAYIHEQTRSNRPEPFWPKKTYYKTLKNAIFRFHRSENNIILGQDYLIEELSTFKNDDRIQDTIDQFDWYAQDCQNRNLITFCDRQNITISPSESANIDIEWYGQVSRIDVRSEGGLVAWLFRKNNSEEWFNELRMPLTQSIISDNLNTPIDEVFIGIYSFEEKFSDYRCYSIQDINNAQQRLLNLSYAFDL